MSSEPKSRSLGRSPLSIAYAPLDQLKPDPKNARQHSAKQIRQIADSIEAFGFNVPILVDADLNVIAGHGRLLACRRLGWTQVPTIRLEHLSEMQTGLHDCRQSPDRNRRLGRPAPGRAVADSCRALDSTSTSRQSASTWARSICESKRLSAISDESAAEPAIPDVARAQPSAAVGDLWLLGRHRVLCGDALRGGGACRALMGTERATAVFSDPPYNVAIDGARLVASAGSGTGSSRRRPAK